MAGCQIAGALAAPWARKAFRRRTSALLFGSVASAGALLTLRLVASFWVVVAILAVWALVFAAARPIRQAFLNEPIPSAQRATVLSADNMLGSLGGAIAQPALGKVADVWGYPSSYLAAAGVGTLGIVDEFLTMITNVVIVIPTLALLGFLLSHFSTDRVFVSAAAPS